MSALFAEVEAYDGDPLRPDCETPTPDSIVAELAPADRIKRVQFLTTQAWSILARGINAHRGNRETAAVCILWSGGNDSNVLAHLMRSSATHAIHANTGIGIEETRQHVRDTCAAWGLPLIEKHAPTPYRDLVLEYGFPGPPLHYKMYQRLKERALDAARHDLGVANSRTKFAVFLAGRRRAESNRRQNVPLHEADGSVIWVSPIALWTKLDLNTYRRMHPDAPHNRVSDLIHMSGECLCGAYAKPGELDEIGHFFPEFRACIEELEANVRAAGIPEPFCRWGHGQGKPSGSGRMCSSCDDRPMLFDSRGGPE